MDNSELTKTKQQPPTKPSVIPTTKFIYETLPKKKNPRKTKAEKLPDLELIGMVKGVLRQYELNQKSVALDIGCSEAMVSQWIKGTAKPTGWSDFEARIRTWLSQEHKMPEKGPAYDFIDESTKAKVPVFAQKQQVAALDFCNTTVRTWRCNDTLQQL